MLGSDETISSNNLSTDIDNTYRCPFQADVYSNNTCLDVVLNHSICVLRQYYATKIVNYFLSTKLYPLFYQLFKEFFASFSLGERTFVRKSKEKPIFPLLFAHLFVPLQRITTFFDRYERFRTQ